MRAPLVAVFAALASALLTAQGPTKEEFEVAAIRPFAPGVNGFPIGVKGGPGTDDPTRMTFTNYSIQNLLVMAYSLKNYQLTAPAWLNEKEARYNIEARIRAGATKEQANEMIKTPPGRPLQAHLSSRVQGNAVLRTRHREGRPQAQGSCR